jgi:hypothetical protein
MGCGVYWSQINELERAMRSLRRLGIDELFPGYQQLNALRGQLLKQVGFKYPRTITQLIRLVGFSPGEFAVWHDVESGWMVEARARPGAPPVYHYVSDEVAVAVMKRELTHELEEELLTPDTYAGE